MDAFFASISQLTHTKRFTTGKMPPHYTAHIDNLLPILHRPERHIAPCSLNLCRFEMLRLVALRGSGRTRITLHAQHTCVPATNTFVLSQNIEYNCSSEERRFRRD
jgi:hypothetical protein